jgi:hypothetical protein
MPQAKVDEYNAGRGASRRPDPWRHWRVDAEQVRINLFAG